jgi:hypothetical protein
MAVTQESTEPDPNALELVKQDSKRSIEGIDETKPKKTT